MKIPQGLLAFTVVAVSSAAAQPIVDVGACARYEHAVRDKRAVLEATETDTAALRLDIAVLESALELCSDYFHLQANHDALKKLCPDPK